MSETRDPAASVPPPARSGGSGDRMDCLVVRTLLAAARQRNGLDAGLCRLVFEQQETAHAIRTALFRRLARHRVNELQFGLLVALLALDPEPVTPADLAVYAAVSRAAVSESVVRLEEAALVVRQRDPADRRSFLLALTERGRAEADALITRYLAGVGEIARQVTAASQAQLLATLHVLRQGAAQLNA